MTLNDIRIRDLSPEETAAIHVALETAQRLNLTLESAINESSDIPCSGFQLFEAELCDGFAAVKIGDCVIAGFSSYLARKNNQEAKKRGKKKDEEAAK